MDLTVSLGLADYSRSSAQARSLKTHVSSEQVSSTGVPASIIPVLPSQASVKNTPTVLKENLEDGGYRLTSTYDREDGRNLIKIEELSLTSRGARKTVVQQNPSGSITKYEEVLDREESGNFRRTQRFQDGNGDISTNITTGYKVIDPFVLTGGQATSGRVDSPFVPTRGTQLDLRA